MINKRPTVISRPKKAIRSVSNRVVQQGTKKVTKVRQGCCMGAKLNK